MPGEAAERCEAVGAAGQPGQQPSQGRLMPGDAAGRYQAMGPQGAVLRTAPASGACGAGPSEPGGAPAHSRRSRSSSTS